MTTYSFTMQEEVVALNKLGVGDIQIGKSVSDLKNFQPISLFPREKRIIANVKKYNYFFLDKKLVRLEDLGNLTDVIVVADERNIIHGIFLYAVSKGSPQKFIKKMDALYDGRRVTSTLAIGEVKKKCQLLMAINQQGCCPFFPALE